MPQTPPAPTQEQIDAANTKQKERFEQARPTGTLLHKVAAQVLANFPHVNFEMKLLNGDHYPEVCSDFFFEDGFSAVMKGERYYFPFHAMASIKILNPK